MAKTAALIVLLIAIPSTCALEDESALLQSNLQVKEGDGFAPQAHASQKHVMKLEHDKQVLDRKVAVIEEELRNATETANLTQLVLENAYKASKDLAKLHSKAVQDMLHVLSQAYHINAKLAWQQSMSKNGQKVDPHAANVHAAALSKPVNQTKQVLEMAYKLQHMAAEANSTELLNQLKTTTAEYKNAQKDVDRKAIELGKAMVGAKMAADEFVKAKGSELYLGSPAGVAASSAEAAGGPQMAHLAKHEAQEKTAETGAEALGAVARAASAVMELKETHDTLKKHEKRAAELHQRMLVRTAAEGNNEAQRKASKDKAAQELAAKDAWAEIKMLWGEDAATGINRPRYHEHNKDGEENLRDYYLWQTFRRGAFNEAKAAWQRIEKRDAETAKERKEGMENAWGWKKFYDGNEVLADGNSTAMFRKDNPDKDIVAAPIYTAAEFKEHKAQYAWARLQEVYGRLAATGKPEYDYDPETKHVEGMEKEEDLRDAYLWQWLEEGNPKFYSEVLEHMDKMNHSAMEVRFKNWNQALAWMKMVRKNPEFLENPDAKFIKAASLLQSGDVDEDDEVDAEEEQSVSEAEKVVMKKELAKKTKDDKVQQIQHSLEAKMLQAEGSSERVKSLKAEIQKATDPKELKAVTILKEELATKERDLQLAEVDSADLSKQAAVAVLQAKRAAQELSQAIAKAAWLRAPAGSKPALKQVWKDAKAAMVAAATEASAAQAGDKKVEKQPMQLKESRETVKVETAAEEAQRTNQLAKAEAKVSARAAATTAAMKKVANTIKDAVQNEKIYEMELRKEAALRQELHEAVKDSGAFKATMERKQKRVKELNTADIADDTVVSIKKVNALVQTGESRPTLSDMPEGLAHADMKAAAVIDTVKESLRVMRHAAKVKLVGEKEEVKHKARAGHDGAKKVHISTGKTGSVMAVPNVNMPGEKVDEKAQVHASQYDGGAGWGLGEPAALKKK